MVTLTKREDRVEVFKDNYNISFIFFIVGFVFFLIIVVTLFIVPENPKTLSLVETIRPIGLDSTFGASVDGSPAYNNGMDLLTQKDCLDVNHTRWVDNICVCDPPYYGPRCQNEGYDARFMAAGDVDINDGDQVEVDIISTQQTTGLSFKEGINCTTICYEDPECVGVVYSDNVCVTIRDISIKSKGPLPFNPTGQSNLYMKKPYVPRFINKAGLFKTETVPSRWWVHDSSDTYLALDLNTPRRLDFRPEKIINYVDGGRIIWSETKFNKDQIPDVLNTSIVTYGGQIPTNLKLPVWVALTK